MKKHTPWGFSQSVREIATGIISYSCASHGGIELSPERLAALLELFPTPSSYAGLPWFEEDCDWAYVALAFPEFFDAESLMCALDMANASEYLAVPMSFFGTDQWKSVVERVGKHRAEVALLWRVGSMSTYGNGWSVSLSSRGASVSVAFKDVPAKQYYSDDDLRAMDCDMVYIEGLLADATMPELLHALRAMLRWSGALPPSASQDLPDFTEAEAVALARAAIQKASASLVAPKPLSWTEVQA